MKYKYFNTYFLGKVIWSAFRFLLLIGISYVILQPYISKISSSFMSREDFVDVGVKLIPKNPTLDTYKAIIKENEYFKALINTTFLSVMVGLFQTLICAIIGYGFTKFKFRGRSILFACVIITMVIPHKTLRSSMFYLFRYFDIWKIYGTLAKNFNWSSDITPCIANLTNTYWPFIILSLTGLGFKNGLYIFIMRQYYQGVPDELEEAAYVDGAGVFKTFVKIILPMSIPMMVTIFMFAFSWQWSDTFYTNVFFPSRDEYVFLSRIVKIPSTLDTHYAGETAFTTAINNTCGLLILAPLVVVYLFGQKSLVQGIERSGITG
jgi:multiple sugar transport system permease protein